MKNNLPYSFYRTWRPEYFSKLINIFLNKNKKKTVFLIGAENEVNLAKNNKTRNVIYQIIL